MRATHTFGIQFVLRPNKKDRSKRIVYARIIVEGERIEISLKKTMLAVLWNSTKGKAKGSSLESKSLNNYLGQVKVKLTECYRELQLKEKKLHLKELKLCLKNNQASWP